MMRRPGLLVPILSIALPAVLLSGAAAMMFGSGDDEPVRAERPQQHTTAVQEIDALTAGPRVAGYVQRHQMLPDYYVTKQEARRAGWQPAKGNLCEVLPGHAIGGDRFGNREKKLPEAPARQWYEADINYRCGQRGADRLLYSNDGLIFVTTDHYRSFQQAE